MIWMCKRAYDGYAKHQHHESSTSASMLLLAVLFERYFCAWWAPFHLHSCHLVLGEQLIAIQSAGC